MKLYKIRNWNETYENNRSRTVKDLAWVAIPNRHDGENFSNIMAHVNGAEIFAAFVLSVQVASRCQPRGTLLRDNKKPHSPATLAIKTRAPVKWFEIAFEYLEENTDWLEVEEFAAECQPPASQTVSTVSPDCQAGAQERKKEGNESTGVVGVQNKSPKATNGAHQGKPNTQNTCVPVFKSGSVEEVLEFQNLICEFYNRPKPYPINYEEQSLAASIIRERPETWRIEWIELKAFRAVNPRFPKFPDNAVTLLKNWQSTLDRSRNQQQEKNEANSVPPHLQLRAIDAQIEGHKANMNSVNYDPKHSMDTREELRKLRARQQSVQRQLAGVA